MIQQAGDSTPYDAALRRGHMMSAAMRTVSDVQTIVTLARSAIGWVRKRRTFSVTVRSDDRLYPAVHEWLLGLLPPVRQRSLLVRTVERYDQTQDRRIASLASSYDDGRPQVVTVNSHRVRVQVQLAGDSVSGDGEAIDSAIAALTRPDKIVISARDEPGRAAVIAHLQALHDERTRVDRRPTLHTIDKWNGWTSRGDLPHRDLESVVLADGQMQRIVADVERFLTSEADYNRRGLPYHRGLLLEGPPGTGKTSIVKALATHFGLDLWTVGLGDVDKDTKLLDLIASVSARSILLLEDVDVFAATRERDKATAPGLSLSGLLNALDGVATPHGLLAVLTTNRPDVLDAALIRPGRVDRRETIGYPDDLQAARLFRVFYGDAAPAPVLAAGKSPAELLEVFKRHEDNPNDAIDVLSASPLGTWR